MKLKKLEKILNARSVFDWRSRAGAQEPSPYGHTASPIKHVIVIIGENRSLGSTTATIGTITRARRVTPRSRRRSLTPTAFPAIRTRLISAQIGAKNALGVTITASDEYCTICNPFQYDTSIMTNSVIRDAHIQDTANLYSDIANGTLPAVSIVKPSGLLDGHPSSSKLDLFEGFSKKIVDEVSASPYAKDTAIFITEDEGGGYYDSGYVQPLDFFGDGTRIIFLVVAPYLKSSGLISHGYADHVSILKFIERNWNLPPVSRRSRDNFPNPITAPGNPCVPRNTPAISDLFDFFNFGQNQ